MRLFGLLLRFFDDYRQENRHFLKISVSLFFPILLDYFCTFLNEYFLNPSENVHRGDNVPELFNMIKYISTQ